LTIGTAQKPAPITSASCTPPSPPLQCGATADCANYPRAVCNNGQCSCSGTSQPPPEDAGVAGDASVCTPPAVPLQCATTADCANYPGAVCTNAQCSCGGVSPPPPA